MNEFKEVTVKIKGMDEDSPTTMNKKFACYNEIRLAAECPNLKDLIDKTQAEFKGTVDQIWVTAKYRIQ